MQQTTDSFARRTAPHDGSRVSVLLTRPTSCSRAPRLLTRPTIAHASPPHDCSRVSDLPRRWGRAPRGPRAWGRSPRWPESNKSKPERWREKQSRSAGLVDQGWPLALPRLCTERHSGPRGCRCSGGGTFGAALFDGSDDGMWPFGGGLNMVGSQACTPPCKFDPEGGGGAGGGSNKKPEKHRGKRGKRDE